MVTTSGNPDDYNDAIQRAYANAMRPLIARMQEALRQMNADRVEQIRQAVQPAARFQEQWNRYIRDILAPAQEQQREVIRQTMEQYTAGFRSVYLEAARGHLAVSDAMSRSVLGLDTSRLARLMEDVRGWQVLTEQQRQTAVAAVQDAYASVSDDDVSDEMVAELEETARDFAAAQTEYLPLTVSRQAFVLYVGTLVLAALMTLSFTNETADGVLSSALGVSPLAGVAMYAAGKAWDRQNAAGEGQEEGS